MLAKPLQRKRNFVSILAVILAAAVSLAQIRIPGAEKIKVPIKIPGLERILKEEPALTTNLNDAVTDIPFLDDFIPQRAAPLEMVPLGPERMPLLLPGLWEVSLRSYCLMAGTYRPSSGEGYVWAPLKGPAAHIIQNALENSVLHPEIPQRDVQVLLWAIIARTKLAECSPEIQNTARHLLSKEEINKLNGGALAKIPPEILNKVLDELPPGARQVFHAEATLRNLLGQAVAVPYRQLEQVAVLDGDPDPPKGSRNIPAGRWSYHPDSFFIRCFPIDYTTMHIQLYEPEAIKVEKDEQGRIKAVEDSQGSIRPYGLPARCTVLRGTL